MGTSVTVVAVGEVLSGESDARKSDGSRPTPTGEFTSVAFAKEFSTRPLDSDPGPFLSISVGAVRPAPEVTQDRQQLLGEGATPLVVNGNPAVLHHGERWTLVLVQLPDGATHHVTGMLVDDEDLVAVATGLVR